uniref:Uncharacterized protein n=1 Tax=Wuchereria bancrofti TaxID=6293 RepID=A0AAF5PVG9_WUCBA
MSLLSLIFNNFIFAYIKFLIILHFFFQDIAKIIKVYCH